ncbi:MAG: preprotein translocase subunit YajC [Cytophagaceae bacterium]|nr:preprotein translocase subunit YajC [Gemmatimonadaceae bacterium]
MIASLLPEFFLLQGAAPGGSIAPFLFQLAAISAIIYFFMIRPQQKQRKTHEERLKNLKRGDMIVTAGGIVGKIVHISDVAAGGDDHLTIESDKSRLIVERARIAKVLGDNSTTNPGT